MNFIKYNGIYIFALLGGLVATVCDGVHVHTRTLAYTKHFLFGQAWWVFPGFVLTFFFMGRAYSFFCDRLPASIPRQKSSSGGNSREFIEAVTTFALVYMLSGFGNFEPVLLSVIFYGTFAARWFYSYDRLWLLILSISMAIGGMYAEGVISSTGLMAYRHVDFFYVPLWLGGLYMHGAFALREGMRYFVYDAKEAL
jgi:hypothetical protein